MVTTRLDCLPILKAFRLVSSCKVGTGPCARRAQRGSLLPKTTSAAGAHPLWYRGRTRRCCSQAWCTRWGTMPGGCNGGRSGSPVCRPARVFDTNQPFVRREENHMTVRNQPTALKLWRCQKEAIRGRVEWVTPASELSSSGKYDTCISQHRSVLVCLVKAPRQQIQRNMQFHSRRFYPAARSPSSPTETPPVRSKGCR